MIEIVNKNLCCGCGACLQRCPKQCMTLQQDNEGFLYPLVDKCTCIDCGICEKVCHELHPYEERTPIQVLAAINKNTDVRIESSSGGIFTLLAEKVINDGGVVFGARFDENWQVVMDYTSNIEGLVYFRGSKYVQARTGHTYQQTEQLLKKGRKVLYTGTPCQIAGLHHFLRKDYENLITVDFVCHGVPSPKVWELYLKEVVTAGINAISHIEFRNKDNGWKKFNFKLITNENNRFNTLTSWHQDNLFMRAFLSNMILRPSCHNCKAKHGASKSDITIADFWGIASEHSEMDDDKGTSLVLINTIKGTELFPYELVRYRESSLDVASKYNPGLNHIAVPHLNRSEFFFHLNDKTSVVNLIDIELPKLKGMHPATLAKRLLRKYKLFKLGKIL